MGSESIQKPAYIQSADCNLDGWPDLAVAQGASVLLGKGDGTFAAPVNGLVAARGFLPFFPEYHDVWAYPQKPYVRGIRPNVMDVHPLKYAWIDTHWSPQ